MLLKAEFEANKSFIEHSQEDMLEAGEKLMSCQKLQDLFYMVLMAGNFLNSVSHYLFRIIARSQNLYIPYLWSDILIDVLMILLEENNS